jgi:hypothetical protein
VPVAVRQSNSRSISRDLRHGLRAVAYVFAVTGGSLSTIDGTDELLRAIGAW